MLVMTFNPPSGNPQPKGHPSYQNGQAAKPEAALANGSDDTKAAQRKQPCRNPENREESDLCAQWEAANAGQENVLWSERSFWVGLLSSIGVAIALSIAYQSNRIARHMAGRELRAYVGVEAIGQTFSDNYLSSEKGVIQIEWLNRGQTPAYNLMEGMTWARGLDPPPLDFGFQCEARGGVTTLAPGQGIHSRCKGVPSYTLRQVAQKEIRVFVWGWAEYNDIFPNSPRRRSECAYELIVEDRSGSWGVSFDPLDRHNGMDFNCLNRATPWPHEKKGWHKRLMEGL